MYLELSPRCVGKTTRLLEAVVRHTYHHPDDRIAVIVVNRGMFHIVEYLLPRGVKLFTDATYSTIVNTLLGGEANFDMVFFDEFDRLSETFRRDLDPQNPYGPYNTKYYYSTTMINGVSDKVYKLLQMNNGKYISYSSFYQYKEYRVDGYNNISIAKEDDELSKLFIL